MPSGQGLSFYASLDDNAFVRGIRGIENQAESAAKKIGAAFATAGTAVTAAATAFAGFAAFEIGDGVRQVFDLTKGLGELSDQTGVSVGRLYELGRQFQNAGMEADDAGAAINKMQKFLQSGGAGGDEKVFDALRLLHLNFLDIKNLSPEHQFDVIGKAIEGLSSPTARAAASMEIFGKSGGRLLRVFSDPKFASGGDLTGRAAILEKNAALFEEASVKLSHAGDVFKTFFTGVAERVATPLVAVLDRIESGDLTKYGEMFGDDLIEGATAVVEMLTAFKQGGISKVASQFAPVLEAGADALFLRLAANEAKFANQLIASFEYAGNSLVSVFHASPSILQKVTDGFTFALSAAAVRFTGAMLTGINEAVSSFEAGLTWIAVHSVGDIETRLKTAAKNFGVFMLDAMQPTSLKIAKMVADIAAGAAGNLAGGTLGSAMGAVVTGQKFDLGASMNAQADKDGQRAMAAFAAAATLAGQAATQSKFEVRDIVGAAALQNRSNAALERMLSAASHLFGASGNADPEAQSPPPGAQHFAPAYTSPLDDTTSTGVHFAQRMGLSLDAATGGLGGPGFSTDDAGRRNARQIREQVQYNNPLLQGGALNAAVQQEQQKQRDQQKIQQFRDTYDKQHPAEAEARKAQQDANKGATSQDIDKAAARFEKAVKELLMK